MEQGDVDFIDIFLFLQGARRRGKGKALSGADLRLRSSQSRRHSDVAPCGRQFPLCDICAIPYISKPKKNKLHKATALWSNQLHWKFAKPYFR